MSGPHDRRETSQPDPIIELLALLLMIVVVCIGGTLLTAARPGLEPIVPGIYAPQTTNTVDSDTDPESETDPATP